MTMNTDLEVTFYPDGDYVGVKFFSLKQLTSSLRVIAIKVYNFHYDLDLLGQFLHFPHGRIFCMSKSTS